MNAYRVTRITSVPFEARKNKISDLQVRCSPTVLHLGIFGRSWNSPAMVNTFRLNWFASRISECVLDSVHLGE